MPLYNCRSQTMQDFCITKLDDDLNPESSYILVPHGDDPNSFSCDCPAGVRPSCRHRLMLPFFCESNRVNSGWCLDWDGGQQWRQFVGPDMGVSDDIEFTDSIEPTPEEYAASLAKATVESDGEGPEQSTLAAKSIASPSQEQVKVSPDRRGEPSPAFQPIGRRL